MWNLIWNKGFIKRVLYINVFVEFIFVSCEII